MNREVWSPPLAHNIDETDDELADWARVRRDSGFFVEPDEGVQNAVAQIADYVQQNSDRVQAAAFLAGADPWVVAHAMASGGRVVTFEIPVPPNSRKVKIPNVCVKFGVEYCNLYTMLRVLGASF